jgi:hypothetical protein
MSRVEGDESQENAHPDRPEGSKDEGHNLTNPAQADHIQPESVVIKILNLNKPWIPEINYAA